jgi:hypothetical protein
VPQPGTPSRGALVTIGRWIAPRPPLLRQLPAAAWTALTWCAAALANTLPVFYGDSTVHLLCPRWALLGLAALAALSGAAEAGAPS